MNKSNNVFYLRRLYSNNHLRTYAMYLHSASTQTFNTGIANAGTSSYNSNGGFYLGRSTLQDGAGGGLNVS